MTNPLPHNPPRQSRSRRTLERIVRASLAILEEEGPEGLTVQAIVSRAESSVGSFYARFSGKDELLDYLGERAWREAADRWDQALASRDFGDLDLRGLIEGSVRLLGEAGRFRATYLKALDRAPGSRDDTFASFQRHVLRGMEHLLLSCSEEMDHPDPPVAVRLGLRAVLAVLDAPEGEEAQEVGSERRMEEAVTLLLSYLVRGDSGDRLDAGQVDFFDIWG